jgi:hypothetical protein
MAGDEASANGETNRSVATNGGLVSTVHAWSPPGSPFAGQSGPLVDPASEGIEMRDGGASGARLERLTFERGIE